MGKLDGRVAIITGASRGIGKAIALKLAKEGADIVVAAKTAEPDPRLPGTIHDTAREVEALGRRALAVKCDVRETDQIDAMVQQALDTFGKVDILINNAGALWWYPVLDTPPKKFDLVMGINARAAFYAARACLPSMIKNKWGHIINMSPPIDLRTIGYHVAYMISKYGMTMIAHGLAEEVKEHNVAVNALWPVTIIESQATINFGLMPREMWRTADILSDSTYAIVEKDPMFRTGQALLDEDVLKADGVTNFDKYRCDPNVEPAKIDWEMIKAAAQMAGASGIGAKPTFPGA